MQNFTDQFKDLVKQKDS
jgi:hypothetical protein